VHFHGFARYKILHIGRRRTKKEVKHTAAGIPTWSPTVVLICRSTAYVWQSGRDAQFSADCGRMCQKRCDILIYSTYKYDSLSSSCASDLLRSHLIPNLLNCSHCLHDESTHFHDNLGSGDTSNLLRAIALYCSSQPRTRCMRCPCMTVTGAECDTASHSKAGGGMAKTSAYTCIENSSTLLPFCSQLGPICSRVSASPYSSAITSRYVALEWRPLKERIYM
jgi:hypothetical protein